MDQTRGQIANSKLVRSLKAGNPLAFREVYNLFEKKLYVFAFSITKSSYISEEIIQEVFIRIWERRELIDPNRSFDSYIFTITRNLVYNYLRDASRREDIRNEFWFNIKEQHQHFETDLILSEYQEIVEAIIDNLPGQKRLIYQLSRQEGKSNSEIAEMLEISPKTVRNHLWHTMKTIRSQLQPYINDTVLLMIIFFL